MDFNPVQYNLENEERRLLEYLPPALRQVLDFQQINAATEPEIRLAWQGLGRVLGNQFLAEADAAGLGVWERELGLYPKAGDSLAVRRARILAAWLRKPPYTLRWLREWLDGLGGPEGHSEAVDGYTLNVQLDYDLLPEPEVLLRDIKTMLRALRPANMVIELAAILKPSKVPFYVGGAVSGGIMSSELPQLAWQQPFAMNVSVGAVSVSITQTEMLPLAWQQDFAAEIKVAVDSRNMLLSSLRPLEKERVK